MYLFHTFYASVFYFLLTLFRNSNLEIRILFMTLIITKLFIHFYFILNYFSIIISKKKYILIKNTLKFKYFINK
jgi:hypothetical protein